MPIDKEIHVELIKLANGDRVLRLGEATTGLCLEKKIDPRQPVVRQKAHLLKVFEAALAHELTTTA